MLATLEVIATLGTGAAALWVLWLLYQEDREEDRAKLAHARPTRENGGHGTCIGV